MAFVLGDVVKGTGLWGLLMAMGIMLIYLPKLQFREAFITLVFPWILYGIIQSNHVFIKAQPLVAATVGSFIFAMLLRLNKNVREAQKDPLAKPVESAVSYGSIVVVFMIAMMVAAYFGKMYSYRSFPNA